MLRDVIKVSVVNFNALWGQKERNLRMILDYIDIAGKEGSNLILFPEMALTGYDDESDVPVHDKMQVRLAEMVPGPATDAVAELTAKYGMYAVFGMPEREEEGSDVVYNAAAFVGPEGAMGTYRKLHPFGTENYWAHKGDMPKVFDTPWGPIGVAICYYTYEFPEILRWCRAKGARLMLNPTAMANPAVQPPNCRTIIEGQIVVNFFYLASANLCGMDKFQDFWGGSSIVGPDDVGQGPHYYAGHPFYTKEGHQLEMYSAAINLAYADTCENYHPIFMRNPYIEDIPSGPDYRPDLYIRMNEDLLHDERWLSLYDEEIRPSAD